MPTLLLAGLSPALAVATSLMFTLGTSISGAITHTKMNNVNWKVALIIGLVGALSAQASNRIVIFISGSYDWLLNIGFIMLQFYFAWILYKTKKSEGGPPVFQNELLASALIGLIIGFLASLFGIGGGFITVPLLINWLGFNTKKAIGTSLADIIIISIGGIIGFGTQLELNYILGLCLIIGAFIGSPLGAKMTTHYESSQITDRLGRLYFFVISALFFDLLASFTYPFLEYVSMAILFSFLAMMLFDFYHHRHIIVTKET